MNASRPDLVHHGKITKVERYGWTVSDRPGVFMQIPKGELLLNRDVYQRDQTVSKVDRIAAEWSWMACGTLTIALREGGFWVADGGHRKMAADKRSDIAELPCMVFEVSSLAEEAAGFVRTNVNRKPISALDRLKGMAASGDAVAQKVEHLARMAGRKIARHSDETSIACVSSLQSCLRVDEETLHGIWPLLVALTAGQSFHRDLVEGLFYAERQLIAGQSLTTNPWRGRLLKVGAAGLLDHMQRAKAFHGKMGPRILGLGVLAAINRHARTEHARFSGMESEQ